MGVDSFSWIVIIGALAFVAFAVMRKRRAETAAVRSPPPWIRLSVLIGLIAATGVVFANLDLAPKLSHMDLVVFSGPQAGHNHVLVDRLADNALRRNGTIENIATQGAAENLELLAKSSDRSRFALVQDSIPFPDKENLELVARLPSPETVFFIGPDANNIRRFADLSGLRIGIGPAGSGSALLARELLGAHGFEALNVTLSRHDFSEQAALLHDGGLDLGVFVISAESELIADAVRGGLQIASFEYLDALPHYIPAARVEWLPAGYYDYLEVLPKSDKKVLRVDTLVLGDRRAPRSDVVSLLALLDQTLHGFIQYNRNTPNNSGLPMAKDLRLFIENDGPQPVGRVRSRAGQFHPASQHRSLDHGHQHLVQRHGRVEPVPPVAGRFRAGRDRESQRFDLRCPAYRRRTGRIEAGEANLSARAHSSAGKTDRRLRNLGPPLPPLLAVDPGTDGARERLPVPRTVD